MGTWTAQTAGRWKVRGEMGGGWLLVVVLLVPRKRPGHAGRKEASGGGFQGLRVEEASGYRPKFRISLERGIRSPELYLG